MKKFGRIINTLIITVGCALFLLACSDMFDFRAPKQSESGEGTFSLVIEEGGASWTIMPTATENDFGYSLVFTPTSGGDSLPAIYRSYANISDTFTLKVDTYSLTVTAVINGDEALKGTLSPIVISATAPASGTVILKPVTNAGAGQFRWDITVPSWAVTATMTFINMDSGADDTINLITYPSSDVYTPYDQFTLNSGYYRVVFKLSNGTNSIAMEEYLHMYNGLNLRYTYSSFPTLPAPSLTYSITLSETGTYNFTTAAAREVTVTNTGTGATGALTIALSGTDAASFTLSKPSITDIAVGGNDTFTVAPAAGISAGTHTATVTVSAAAGNSNSITAQTFNVSFTAEYGISLKKDTTPLTSTDTLTFTAVNIGAASLPEPLPITVANTGNMATGALTVALTGAGAGNFKLNGGTAGASASISSIAVGAAAEEFTVQPASAATAGTYEAIVTVSNSTNGISESFNVSFTVYPTGTGSINISFNISDKGTSISITPDVPATLTSTPVELTASQSVTWEVFGPNGAIVNTATDTTFTLDASDYTSGQFYSLRVTVTIDDAPFNSTPVWFTVTP